MPEETRPSQRPIPILYKDDCYLVVDKPAGLLVVPTPQKEKNTLTDIVNAQCRTPQQERIYPCHRLDRETSGVIIYAKGQRNQELLAEQFKHGRISKKYIAFVQGKLKNPAGEIKSYIRDREQERFQRDAPAKFAITRYKVLEVRRRFSIVEVNPVTGRTNQIRIHFSEIKHPLVGERQYAFGKDFELKFRRTALHASEVEFINPVSRKKVSVTSSLPEDMESFWSSTH